ncbi:phosphoribosylaminoimidazolesuccinocarboxamide synthase [Alkalibacter rhizosphaerae]|uniref:Phosphoribosylaminoimidazole-succinocarboxamide synthase n=1 Tax=Alkalibacter rhizosphaerae TaxID=2815577 RepID=A0A974XFN9_9FIRM|nr:phosphoribosylaminoimidazolesuccinocarboxamide synthase [Alkalibacter rhizosphaerae]QSX07428.1 phosphoribosylaminoimidazolesuccinocarboxamide synthase [Alkalibacter rhizosphaerae]
MKKFEMLYEGKAKRVFRTDESDRYVVEYKDDATAFDGTKKGQIAGKAVVNNKISGILFSLLHQHHIPTHFIEVLSDTEQLVKAVEIIPLEVIVRNVAAGSFSKRLGVEEGILFEKPVLEFSYKNDAFHDPLVNDDHIRAMGLASEEEVRQIKEWALRINDVLQAFFLEKGLKLIDFKLEFGRFEGQVILADEISPDTCRLWDVKTNEKMDKDRFRRDLGKVEETYQEVLRRLV